MSLPNAPLLPCFSSPGRWKRKSSWKNILIRKRKELRLWTAEASEKQNLEDPSRRLGISSLIGGAGVSSCVFGQVLITSDFYRQPALRSSETYIGRQSDCGFLVRKRGGGTGSQPQDGGDRWRSP